MILRKEELLTFSVNESVIKPVSLSKKRNNILEMFFMNFTLIVFLNDINLTVGFFFGI